MASLKRNVVEHEPINNIFLNFLVEWEKKKNVQLCCLCSVTEDAGLPKIYKGPRKE